MELRRVLVPALAGVLLLTGCTEDAERPDAPEAVTVAWAEQPLPAPAGAPGRTVVRDAVQCGDGWWVVGAVLLDHPTETRDTRPAAWFSPDRASWTAVEVDATTYWGRRAILGSVACSRGRIAVVGARSGGAHGNPRVTTFRLDGDRLVDVPALFIQYGGVTATNVGPVAGGPTGWLITGNRTSGPGVWFTDDPREFTRVEEEPGLTDDGDLESLAQGAGWSGEEWVLVGSGARTGRHLDPDPLAWTSPDGLTWTPDPMPPEEGVQDVHRVVALDGGRVLAVGRSEDAFAAWVRGDDGWGTAVGFGAVADSWRGAPYVASLVRTPVGVLATLSTGDHYELWQTSDGASWQRAGVPLEPQTAGDHSLVAAEGDALLLVGDAGDGGHVWSGTVEPAQ
ncbi:hypothetical protein ASC64_16775 [Nocardioides sp. Root122]|uniref:hypothetical protein n=1 Tax=Nocardioides TaxID=1839 RepID=UPI000702EBEC|nr:MULTISPECIES: hypothetical protein [Nocardioides]KQV63266.1 hypothetical protein ASC64_16775 [Nocardioides sp. Root122]MCK9824360.1 hypothetical protein [Nocardioides cavernae]